MAKYRTPTYRPVSKNLLDQEILSYCQLLKPVETADELFILAWQCLNEIETPEMAECLIDGISRLCDVRPPGFYQKAISLLNQLDKKKDEKGSFPGGGRITNAIRNLISNWLTGNSVPQPFGTIQQAFHFDFGGPDNDIPVLLHIERIAKRVRIGRAASLLSMPTHSGGWIDPEIWVSRLTNAETSGAAFDVLDICISLLRLAPDRRRNALLSAQKLSGGLASLACFALGGDTGPTFSDRKDHILWISAARVREPEAHWKEYFAPLKLRDDAPNALGTAFYQWKARLVDNAESTEPFLDIKTIFGKGPPPKAPSPADHNISPILLRREMAVNLAQLPTVMLTRLAENSDIAVSGWERHWLYNIWPQDTEALLFHAAATLIGASPTNPPGSGRRKNWQPLADLEILTRKYRPWKEGAHLLLVTALGSEFGDTRRASIDLLIRGIDYRLFDPEIFVRILSELSAAGWEKHKYWGEGMLDAARFSSLHATVIGQCVESWLAQSNAIRNYAHLPLEILTHVHTLTGLPLRPTTLQKLRLLKGKTKAAKLASYLIRLQSPVQQVK